MVQIRIVNQPNITALRTYRPTDQAALVTTVGHQNYVSTISWPSGKGEVR